MKNLTLILCLFLTACCQGTTYRASQHHVTQTSTGMHLGTPDEPLAHTNRGLNPVSETLDRIGN